MPLQFINELSGHDRWSGSIVWLDFTKYGKLSGSDLNDCCDLLAMILGRKPQKSVGLIMAPHLISEKVHNGLRGEMRSFAENVMFFCARHSMKSVWVCLPKLF